MALESSFTCKFILKGRFIPTFSSRIKAPMVELKPLEGYIRLHCNFWVTDSSVENSRSGNRGKLRTSDPPKPRNAGALGTRSSIYILDGLLKVCQENGETLVREGLITLKDIEDAKSSKDTGKVISIGLPAYSLLQMLLNSAKSNSADILIDKL